MEFSTESNKNNIPATTIVVENELIKSSTCTEVSTNIKSTTDVPDNLSFVPCTVEDLKLQLISLKTESYPKKKDSTVKKEKHMPIVKEKILPIELKTLLESRTTQGSISLKKETLTALAMSKLKILDRSLFELKNPKLGSENQREVCLLL